MKYEIWDSVSYGHMEPLQPFTKLFESDDLNKIRDYITEHNNDEVVMFITSNGKILTDTSKKIYESFDGNIFKRTPLNNKRKQI